MAFGRAMARPSPGHYRADGGGPTRYNRGMPAPRKQEQWWRDDENIIILNRGEVQLAVPRVWLVEGKGEGTASYLQLKDPGDNCSFNISPISIPPLVPETPPIEEMLREVL